MPIALNTDYDALVIVLDDRSDGDGSFFRKEVGRIFEKRKIIYYENCSMEAQELYQNVSQRIAGREVLLPSSNRIIFCNYLDLNCFHEDWLDKYRKRMKYFKDMATASPMQHYHVTFFRYQTSNPLGQDGNEILRLLNQFWETDYQYTLHTEFLVYIASLGGNLKSQEEGMVRLLYLLSCRNHGSVYRMNDFRDGLYVLNGSSYYEDAARIYMEKIQKEQRWLQQRSDPGLNKFWDSVKENVSSKMKEYQEEVRQFKSMAGMYPVSIKEYVQHGVGPWKSYTRPSGVEQNLEKEKRIWQQSFMASIENCQEKESWKNNALQEMHYQDLDELFRSYEPAVWTRLHQIIESSAQNKQLGTEEKKNFEESFQTWIKELFSEQITASILERRREEAQNQITDLQNIQRAVARYQNLRVCFANIECDTKYQVPAVIQAKNVGEFVFIDGKLGDSWAVNGYSIANVPDNRIIIHNDIHPYQILLIKIGKYVSLDPANPNNVTDALDNVLF